ncbi:NtaA/DmoA family FMN-dependent monooxygenase [Sphingomonadales bacterium 56]|uniref:NtaA/DmoA family FMN-dependent monooxygenase n=1 Tax=unclassified Sphingobium TaxID=2611147 RepID=UPI001918ABB7|nr:MULTISPECIES: NtaA/DmoA family FMN-dependent monooxygenase [unclassified Sphingobium]MBY2929917.1 NtaA/DmoA family FMN-dependent monooxygenase [Sphingomonadales bacterium 56]MBY2959834.1 NtaA/DmoA family FMN-dependent monooxygenase [Sphingomonadales bacterium 58]CAD7339838.1 Nitrilotriacetate monooxygenase component A [Sphingobium sp. S8]CAD7340418.1 Nitrilotriacetate monooxygenase component A [Sphingobium sp. S6]
MAHKKFHLGYFTKFGATSWPGDGTEFGSQWADGSYHKELARMLEAAKFDFIFFEDTTIVGDRYGGSMELDLKNATLAPKLDPLPLLPLMAQDTSHIGLIATASTTFYPPYLLARLLSTIDSLTKGRAGWNMVTSSEKNAALNFGLEKLLPPSERYDIADEFVELCKKLWDSWEEGALVANTETGVYVDHTKVHTVNFQGKHFRSRGPLNTLRSPQGYPVLAQAGASDRGRDFSSKNAEVVLGMMTGGVKGMKAYRDDIRNRAEKQGRNPDDIKVFFLTPLNILPENGEVREMTEADKQAAFEHNIVMASSSLDIDFSQYDLDAPVPQDIVAGGHTSALEHMKKAGREEGKSLRDLFSTGKGGSNARFRGTAQQVADQLMAVMDEVGGDGILIEGSGYNHQLPALLDGVIPALQKAGAVRTEYKGTTLREILREF